MYRVRVSDGYRMGIGICRKRVWDVGKGGMAKRTMKGSKQSREDNNIQDPMR